LDLGRRDHAVLPQAEEDRFDGRYVLQIGRIVLEIVGTEPLYDRAGADHGVLADHGQELLLCYGIHDDGVAYGLIKSVLDGLMPALT
jgi:hypothetical protein